jgi:5-methylcytosine-specific restriction endonuclease McrA
MQSHLKSRSVDIGLDFSHFPGKGWSAGRPKGRKPLEYYLVKDGPFIRSDALKKRLIKDGVKEHKCERCLNTQWLGEVIPLELDHINGDHEDNRIENLRLLCPNCHAQTETYCGKTTAVRHAGSTPALGTT